MTERRGVICAGNWIVDLVHDISDWPDESNLVRIGAQTRGIGGGAANVISALAKLKTGLPLWPMGAVGDDDYGAFVIEACRRLGLPTDRLTIKEGIATAHTHVMSVAGRSRTFFYQGGANDALDASDFPTGTFSNTPAKLFYLGYLSLLGELDAFDAEGMSGAVHVLDRARKAGLVTCVDLVSIDRPGFSEITASAAPFIDYLVLNEIEAARATGRAVVPDDALTKGALAEMAHDLLGMGVRQAVIAHCEKFSVWADATGGTETVDVVPLPRDQVESHLGAGDAFCAGILYAVHEGWAPDASIRLGHAVARESLRGLTATSAIPALETLDIG